MASSITVYKDLDSGFTCCAVLFPFRLFYCLDGSGKAPKSLKQSAEADIPEYVVCMLNHLEHAYGRILEEYQLMDPLKEGMYCEKGAKFVDVLLADIPVQKGLVSTELIDNSDAFKDVTKMQGKAIKIQLHNDLVLDTATPIHELFHIFQYNYCSFNNMWFMEGLARWSQNITHDRRMIDETLPQNLDELDVLLNRKHDAEYFWRQLLSFIDSKSLFIRKLLEESVLQAELLESSGKGRKYLKNHWSRDEKKAAINNRYILEALKNSILHIGYRDDPEIDGFLSLIANYHEVELQSYNTPSMQELLVFLRRIDETLVQEKEGILYSNHFDVPTKTLRVTQLECIDATVEEINLLGQVFHIEGDLILKSDEISQLNGFNSLKSVRNLQIRSMKNLKEIGGFNSLAELGSLEISYNPNLKEISGFSSLFQQKDSIKGSVKVMNNEKLKGIAFLKGVRSVGSSLYLHKNSLTNLRGLESLEEVRASVSLYSNKLSDITALSKLKEINGMLGLSDNHLTSLMGLESLEKLKTTTWNKQNRTLNIHGNKDLTDISALRNILTNERYVILLMDDPKQYTKRPSAESNFHKNILEIYRKDTNEHVPTYEFVTKESHDYSDFGKTTHSERLDHLFDFELDADILVISFSGYAGWLGGMFNSRYPFIINKIKTHKIFIMDKHDCWYHLGLDHFTKNIEETISLIENLSNKRKYSKILCVGASMGGYMALLTGPLIGATNVLSLSPQTFLDNENRQRHEDKRWRKNVKKINDLKASHLDLKPLYKELPKGLKVEIHYSTNSTFDEIHAYHLDNKEITVIGHKESNHYLAVHLHKRNMLEGIVLKHLGITPPKEYREKRLEVLFGNKWQKAGRACKWMKAHHMNFKELESTIEYGLEHEIRILFGNNYYTQKALTSNRERLWELGFRFISNSMQTLRNLVDKQLFHDIMLKSGLGEYVPKHYASIDEIEYPCMVKIKSGGAGRGMFIAYSSEEMASLEDNMLMTEYLPGTVEYATSIFTRNGEILRHATFSKTSTKKEVYILQHEAEEDILMEKCDTPFLDLFQKIVRVMSGNDEYCQCSINFKIVNGKPKIFEINPRIGYTLAQFPDDFKEMMDCYINETRSIELRQMGEKPLLFSPAEMAEITKGTWENLRNDTFIREFHHTFHYLGEKDCFVVASANWPNRAYKPSEHRIPKVVQQGASAIIVEKNVEVDADIPTLRVENSYDAIKELARHVSQKTQAKKVLITGSFGKTGFKLNLLQIAKDHKNSYGRYNSSNYAASNYCNLASMKEENELFFLEIPLADKEKIERRSRLVNPDIGVITSIGHEGIERFKTLENIIENKLAIATGIKEGGTLLLPHDDKYYPQIRKEAEKYPHANLLTYGTKRECNAHLLYKKYGSFAWDVIACIEGIIVAYRVPFFEEYAVSSSLGVLLCAHHLGLDVHAVAAEYHRCQNFKSSGILYKATLNQKSFLLYDQSCRGGLEGYESFFKTMRSIEPEKGGKKVLVTSEFVDYKDGEMEFIDTQHFQELIAASGIQAFFTVEKFSEHINVLPDKTIWKNHSIDYKNIKGEIMESVENNDILCIKGIFESSLPKFVDEIKSLKGIAIEELKHGSTNLVYNDGEYQVREVDGSLFPQVNDIQESLKLSYEETFSEHYFLRYAQEGNVFGIFAAKRPKKLLGYLVLKQRQEWKEFFQVAVDKPFQRQGLCFRLMVHAIHFLQKKNQQKIYLMVNTQNKAALQLYQNIGFKVVKEKKGYFKNGHDAFKMDFTW